VEAWAQELHDAASGYGPLQRLFDGVTVEEIWIKCRLTTVSLAHCCVRADCRPASQSSSFASQPVAPISV